MTPARASNPFVGLRPFEKGDAHLFFGRDEQVDHLLERLRAGRFVAVLGASGSGKSSLIRAGLLPALEGGFNTKAGSSWRIAVLRPGASPIRSLALALSEIKARSRAVSPNHVAMIEATIRRGSFGIIDALREAGLQPGEQVMVVVDQFEELFTFKRVAASIGASEDAALFVKLLLAAVRHRDWPVHVVLTMRAEFLGTCSEFRELPEAISDGLFLIPRLNRDQLAQAITGPIAVAGARIAPSLVQRLLNDVGDDPDQLPVLQHALMRMWDRWQAHGDGEQLALQHYEAVGEMRQALSNHVDEAFHSLSEPQKRIAQKAFKCLTERTQEGTDLRRPTALGELAEVAQADLEATRKVINVFREEGRSFLTPSMVVPIVSESVIDISHESLIRQWDRLNEWVGEEFSDRNQYRRVDEAAAGHEAQHESLWRGPALQSALRWRDRFKPTEAWARRYGGSLPRALKFLDQSRSRRRILWGAIAAGLVLGTSVTAWQLEKSHKMEDDLAQSRLQAANAETERATALVTAAAAEVATAEARNAALKTAYELAQRSLSAEKAVVERDKELAVRLRETNALRQGNVLMRADMGARASATGGEVAALVAMHMLRRAQQTGNEEAAKAAESALQKHLALLPPLRWKGVLQGAVTALTVGSDGQLVVSGDDSSEPSDAQFWSEAGKLAASGMKVDPGAATVAVSGDARTVAWTSENKLMRWSRDAGAREPLSEPFFEDVRKLALSANGRFLLGLNNGGVRLWDLEGGAPADLYRGSSTAIAFTADGRTAAAAVRTGKENSLLLWDVRTPAQTLARIPIAGASAAQKIAFSPNGTYLAVAAGNSLHAWRLTWGGSGGVTADSIGPNDPFHSRPVRDIAFSTNEQVLATASEDGTAVVLRLNATPLAARSLDTVKHEGIVTAVALSPDGRTLATASDDGTARAWRGARWQEVARVAHPRPVRAVAFLADGSLITGSLDGSIKVSALTPVAVGRAGDVLPTATTVDAACTKLSRNLSSDEWLEFFTTDPYVSACPGLTVDPKDLLHLQLKHALNGNAAPAHEAFLQFKQLNNVKDIELDELLETSEAQAKAGNKADATALLRHAPALASSVTDPFDLVDVAKQLVEAGARTEADEVLQRATKLAVTGRDPNPLVLVEIADALRGLGRKNEALEVLNRATKLAAGLTDPSDLADVAVALAEAGRRTDASEMFKRASTVALSTTPPRGNDNNDVCWRGAIHDFPTEVLPSCEAAVQVTKDARNLASYRDSRGVAYALTGKADLALADFEAFVANRSPTDTDGKVRAEWVRELKQGRNPFATNKEKVLAPLRR